MDKIKNLVPTLPLRLSTCTPDERVTAMEIRQKSEELPLLLFLSQETTEYFTGFPDRGRRPHIRAFCLSFEMMVTIILRRWCRTVSTETTAHAYHHEALRARLDTEQRIRTESPLAKKQKKEGGSVTYTDIARGQVTRTSATTVIILALPAVRQQQNYRTKNEKRRRKGAFKKRCRACSHEVHHPQGRSSDIQVR